MPAQWEKYSLRTQREMMEGRNATIGGRIAQWADEGEAWLREQFKGKGLIFHTSWSVDDSTITLHVHRGKNNKKYKHHSLIFEVTEKAECFVSHLTVTKLIMIS